MFGQVGRDLEIHRISNTQLLTEWLQLMARRSIMYRTGTAPKNEVKEHRQRVHLSAVNSAPHVTIVHVEINARELRLIIGFLRAGGYCNTEVRLYVLPQLIMSWNHRRVGRVARYSSIRKKSCVVCGGSFGIASNANLFS